MRTVISILAVAIGIAGCASAGPEASTQPASEVADTAVRDGVAVDPAVNDDAPAEEIEYMEAPPVEQVASVSTTRDEMICKRIRLTGSNRMEKVCRPRSEIDATMRDAQEAVRKLERNAAKSASN